VAGTETPAAAGPAASASTPAPAVAASPAPASIAPTALKPEAISLAPPPSAATPVQSSERAGLSPTVFWIAASTTIIVASLGGFQALHVRDLYDQANGLPVVSPEREPLHDRMKSAEVTADVLLLGSLALAAGTTILAFYVDWSGSDLPREVAQPSATGRRWW
jgi:hypothetical protein